MYGTVEVEYTEPTTADTKSIMNVNGKQDNRKVRSRKLSEVASHVEIDLALIVKRILEQ